MKKVVILSSFFVSTPLLIFISIVYFTYLTYQKTEGRAQARGGIAYAALPPPPSQIEATIGAEESREEIVRQFFEKYNSPLTPYASDIVDAANRWGIDYKLLPAIAMQESNLCRRVIKDSHNCWGWGIHGTKVTRFTSYPEAIETISKGLATKYRDQKGLTTPHEIARVYNPSNTNNWVENVTTFMNDLK